VILRVNSRRAQGYSANSRRAQNCDVFTQGFNQPKKKEREFNNKSQMSSLKKSKLGSRTQACRSKFCSSNAEHKLAVASFAQASFAQASQD